MQRFKDSLFGGLALPRFAATSLTTALIMVNCSIQERQINDHQHVTPAEGGSANTERNDSSNVPGGKDPVIDNQHDGDPDTREVDENGKPDKIDSILAGSGKPVPVNPQEPASASPSSPPPAAAQEYTLLDFEDGQLRDGAWLEKQPKGITQTYLSGKGDSGIDKLSIAAGQGRNGGKALAVEYTTRTIATPDGPKTVGSGLPGFWVLRARPGGLAYGKDGYLLPDGRRANQIEFWVKFPKGFRKSNASAKPMYYPNHINFIFGTYHFDPNKIGKGDPVKESDNWHFYHQIFLRHDKAEDDWIRVVLNETPQHQRSHSNRTPAVNPTAHAGNYFEIMTRFYIDCHRYFDDPEIPADQVKMLVDDIKFRYVPPQQKVSVAFNEIPNAALKTIKTNVQHLVHFTVRNDGDVNFSGRLAPSNLGPVSVQITDLAGTKVRDITVPAKSSATYTMRVLSTAVSSNIHAGVSLVSLDQLLSDANSNTRSLSSNYVEKRWNNDSGPHDAEVKGVFLRLQSEN